MAGLFIPTSKQFLFLVFAYFALNVITRSIVMEAAGIDEADQLVRAQHWAWGYGPQAPLYTWLMTLFLKTFGYSVFSLTLLRELMLFGIYSLTYFNARGFTGSHLCGVVAALVLQFHPSIVWESQRELTNSLPASLMVLAMLLAFQHLRKDRLWPWIAFGICAGLAILSKYNAVLVWAALLIAAITIPTPGSPLDERSWETTASSRELSAPVEERDVFPPGVHGCNARIGSGRSQPVPLPNPAGGEPEAPGSAVPPLRQGEGRGEGEPRVHLPGLGWRACVLDWRMGLSLVMTGLVVLPNLLWAIGHRAEASGSMYKFGIHADTPWLTAVSKGLDDWFETSLLHILPVVLLFAIFFWKPFAAQRSWRRAPDEVRLLWRVFLILNVIVAASILIFKVTAFKERWMQPLFIWLPILLVLAAKDLIYGWRAKTLIRLGAAITLVMATLIPGRLFLTEWRGRRDVMNAPFRKFAVDLAASVSRANCIVAGDYWLAGNLILRFPEKQVYSLDLNPPETNVIGSVLLWDATSRREMPRSVSRFANDVTGSTTLARPIYLEEKWKYHRSKTMRIGVLNLPARPG